MTFVLSIAVRALQALVEAAPTLVVGVAIAAYLRVVVGPEQVRRLFSGEGTTGLWRAALLALFTPVCALGVLPVAAELLRAGVSTAKVMAFALAAPLLNPITLCYGLTTLDLRVFALIVTISILYSFAIGAITGRWLENSHDQPQDSEHFPVFRAVGLRRMFNLAVVSSRVCCGNVLGSVLLCIVVSGLVATLVPSNWLVPHLRYTDATAPLTMTAVAVPAYVSPTTGLMQVSTMSKIQSSLGAAVALHLLGVGLNAAVLVWIVRLHGLRRFISLSFVVLGMTWAMGYGADAVFDHPPGAENDTHALDNLARVNPSILSGGLTWEALEQSFRMHAPSVANYVALAVFALGAVCGGALKLLRIEYLPDRLQEAPEEDNLVAGRGDMILPRSVVVGFSTAVFVVLGITVAYVYYPPVNELFEEMSSVRADALISVRTSDRPVAIQSLDAWHDAAGKIPISAALRRHSAPEGGSAAVRELCDRLQSLRNNIAADSLTNMQDSMKHLDE